MGKQLYQKRKESRNGMQGNEHDPTGKNSKGLPKIQSKAQSIPVHNQKQLSLVIKSQLIDGLEKSFRAKLSMDEQVKLKLFQQEEKKIQKQKRIQQELQQINRQNTIWIHKLNDHLKAIENRKQRLHIEKAMKEEKELIQYYNSLLEEQQKIKLTKEYRSKLQKDHWQEIAKEKHKLSHIIHENQKQLLLIARTKSHEVHRKKQPTKTQEEPKKEDESKNQKNSKNIEELKELGRKYLEFAKKAQKSKSERRLLKVENKNIDYAQEIKELIKLKVDDLSKKPELQLDATILSKRKKMFKNTLASTDSLNFAKKDQSLLKETKISTDRSLKEKLNKIKD